MALRQFKLPDLGEGLTEGEILKWLVHPGDTVHLNQPIVEVETAKAAVEVPSPYAGVVAELHYGEGALVDVGAPIITVDTDPSGDAAGGGTAASAGNGAASRGGPQGAQPLEVPGIPAALMAHPPDDGAVEPGLIGGPAPGGRTSVLVGYGPKSVTAQRRPRKPGVVRAPVGQSAPGSGQASDPAAGSASDPVPSPSTAPDGSPTTTARPPARVSAAAVGEHAARLVGTEAARAGVLAKPPVRKLARDSGVDLRAVPGTGPGGTITRSDVVTAAGSRSAATTSADAHAELATATADAAIAEPMPEVDPAARESRIPIKGVRKMMASAMVTSAFTAPHVTVFATVDVTPSMELLTRVRALPDFAGLGSSPLLLVAKALLLGLRRHPLINSSWDEVAQEIVIKDYVNLGIAAATPRGLTVPNIKDAGRLGLPDLARALQDLTDTARAGRSTPADLTGGTISITNVGVFGMDTGTPILNPGEAAILCLGAIRPMPWVHDGEITVRQVTQLGMSFDHRIIDGELGAAFLADIVRLLGDPTLFTVWG